MGNEQLILHVIDNLEVEYPQLTKTGVDYPQEKLPELRSHLQAIGSKVVDGFVLDENNWYVYVQLVRWAIGDSKFFAQDPISKKPVAGDVCKGIYLAGNTGAGKTVATKILKALYKRNVIKVGERSLDWRDAHTSEIISIYARTGDIEEYKTSGVLCIQDLGSESPEALFMGNRMNVLQDILLCRAENPRCVTIVTSNWPMAGDFIRKMYGDRVYSRLFKMFNYLELKGPDRRRK